MKIGDLVKATPASKWDMDPEDNAHIGVITKMGIDERLHAYPAKVILLNFGDDDGIFRSNDWKFEVISENR